MAIKGIVKSTHFILFCQCLPNNNGIVYGSYPNSPHYTNSLKLHNVDPVLCSTILNSPLKSQILPTPCIPFYAASFLASGSSPPPILIHRNCRPTGFSAHLTKACLQSEADP
ncbi:unnamed protein product [Protopolystoma xenopodis]|uniref:Uncharacterized protein n=1 Tax=Protopolystoma xenopodis TaxID=117903 RepID=A0A448X096_9PLAT|nr:unnamed protein product [Protopolystoma xenopodis]